MIYLDSSALVTLIVEREHVETLEQFLQSQPSMTYTSTIGFIETVRTCDRIGTFPGLMSQLLADYEEVPVTDEVRDEAAQLPGFLRSLDAIHVASAAQLGPLTALVTYDQRMADAARDAGLPVVMPGVG